MFMAEFTLAQHFLEMHFKQSALKKILINKELRAAYLNKTWTFNTDFILV